MRLASVVALAAAIGLLASSFPANAKDYEQKRTRIIIKKRSYLDAGTEVKPGTARYTNYLWAIDNRFPTYGPPNENINPRTPLPGPFELPGFPKY